MTKLRLQGENYINSEEAFQAVDDLNLSDFGVVRKDKTNLTPNSIRAKLSIKKRPALIKEIPRKDQAPRN